MNIIDNGAIKTAISLVFIQQVFLAGSTWSIGLAGASVAKADYDTAKFEVICFFGLALMAYSASSVSQFYSNRAHNEVWRSYTYHIIDRITGRAELSSKKNTQRAMGWLSSEALSTAQLATSFYIEFIATTLNILLTLIVFFLSLGPIIGSVLGLSFFVSLLSICLFKSKIKHTTNLMQASKISTLVHLAPLWANGLFGNRPMIQAAKHEFQEASASFFKSTESYVKVEQLLACLPIAISVIVVATTAAMQNTADPLLMGTMVALLPRTLQLFGNMHSLSLYLAQWVMIKQKLNNLDGFAAALDSQELGTQINETGLTIINKSTDQAVPFETLMRRLSDKTLSQGRILITGGNGAGKSSCLKLIKSITPDAILFCQDSEFELLDQLSTGQAHKIRLETVLRQSSGIFLLDEWDANLDSEVTQALDEHIDRMSDIALVIEVRHKTPIKKR